MVTPCSQSRNSCLKAFLNYSGPFLILKFHKQWENIESVIKTLERVLKCVPI